MACKGEKFAKLRVIRGIKGTIKEIIKYHSFLKGSVFSHEQPPYTRLNLDQERKTADEPETDFIIERIPK
jgi:hypothetical protein